MANFAILGVGGYIAPRHLEAIYSLGHKLICAYDKSDSVGLLDRYELDCQFFTEFEMFEEFLDHCRGTSKQIDYISICSPNYLHSTHIKFALAHGANVICEKPLVLSIRELDDLINFSNKYNLRVNTVLQLRVHEAIIALKKKVNTEMLMFHNVELKYFTTRGNWYDKSWKGDTLKSGGLSTNIGIHFFDMLCWIFGKSKKIVLKDKELRYQSGELFLEKARVQWELSIDVNRLPIEIKNTGKTTYRSLNIDGESFEFSEGFSELHQRIYEEAIAGNGFGLEDVRNAIEVVEYIRNFQNDLYQT